MSAPFNMVIISIFSFIGLIFVILYIFRDKNRISKDIKYDHEGSLSNPNIDQQVNRTAFFHTRGNTYRGTTYGPSINRPDLKKNQRK